MDKISKALQKLSSKEQTWVKEILQKIQKSDFQGMDVQKLREKDDIFRVRKGNIRMIWQKTNKNISILAIERRSEKTYRRF
jgi:mRNA-degrading endonuclease RelE of RelBE toxin-antitoxin system